MVSLNTCHVNCVVQLTRVFEHVYFSYQFIFVVSFCTMLSHRLGINHLHPRLFGWCAINLTSNTWSGGPKPCMWCHTEVDTTSPNFLKDLSSALKARNVGILLANTIMQLGINKYKYIWPPIDLDSWFMWNVCAVISVEHVLIAVICGFRCHPYDIFCAVFAPKMISSWSSFHMMFWGFITDSVPEMYQDSAVELNHPNTVAGSIICLFNMHCKDVGWNVYMYVYIYIKPLKTIKKHVSTFYSKKITFTS